MKAIDFFNDNKIKRTSCREAIIEVLINENQALSENEIKEKLTDNYDRTTLYRSFKTLDENSILHKIMINNQVVKYALGNIESKHAHFYCNNCQKVKCLDSVHIEKYEIPEGYTNDETEVLIKGKCVHCKSIN